MDLLLEKMRVLITNIVCVIISVHYAASFFSYIRKVIVENYETNWAKTVFFLLDLDLNHEIVLGEKL